MNPPCPKCGSLMRLVKCSRSLPSSGRSGVSVIRRTGKSKIWKCDKCKLRFKAGSQRIVAPK